MPPVLIRDLHLAQPLMVGEDVEAMRRSCKKYLRESLSDMPAKESERRTYGHGMHDLVRRAQDEAGLPTSGIADNRLLEMLRKQEGAVDRRSDFLLKKYAALHPARQVPDLGPIYRGGRSLLLQDLTHETSGIPGYPAFDDGWKAGRAVIAPEQLQVTEQSGSQGGDAFYARGASSLKYWIGHLVAAPATGSTFKKGAVVGVIASIPQRDGGPHVHTGIDARPLIGHELLHHDNYTHGAPTVGEQLRKWAHG